MKLLYPVADQVSNLTNQKLTIKIARHSACTSCTSCSGLHPPASTTVVLDIPKSGMGTLDEYGSDDDEELESGDYMEICACGHEAVEHGADISEIGTDEFKRRGRVAFRLDEILQDVDKLLDFEYTDEDITSLRLQMKLPVSQVSISTQGIATPAHSSMNESLSPVSSLLSDAPPPTKKRRISMSSLSDADDDEDEDDDEDQPLAARMAPKSGANAAAAGAAKSNARSGKKKPGKTVGGTAPTSMAPPTGREQAEMNGVTHGQKSAANGHSESEALKVKIEDKISEGQLNRLATGVTVDASGTPATPTVKTEKAAIVELRKGIIQITAVSNDAQPRSLVILTGLKTLFQKQLPKMPREYIARLVYDSNSRGLAIIKKGYKVVGGICFRPFPHRGFAEIVFFATASVDQVKGYGGMLMDHFKTHIQKTYPGMDHFLTYADNYAVGYFRKQGFSKEITLDRAIWAGYIKDYEGGTIMQCTMVRKFDYLDKAGIIGMQREAIVEKIREMSKSHIIHEGLAQFRDGAGEGVEIDPKNVPGLKESGWTPEMATSAIQVPRRGAEHHLMQRLLADLQGHSLAWPFLQPVDDSLVEDYYDVIKKPMDLSTMEHKLETNQYGSLRPFIDDAHLIFDNCRLYNPEGTIYHKNATRLQKFLTDQVAERMKTEA